MLGRVRQTIHQLDDMQEQQQPADVGFEAHNTWTLPLVAKWIKWEFGFTMNVSGISAMLKRMNFSFTEVTYTLAKANEQAQVFFRQHTFAQLMHVEAETNYQHLFFQVESMIRSYRTLQYNLFPPGKQLEVKHTASMKETSTVNYETCLVHHQEVAPFIRFLQKLLSAYPDRKIAMAMENIYHAT